MRKYKNVFRIIQISLLCILFFSCRTMADYNFSHIDLNTAKGNYEAVYAEIASSKSEIYSSADTALKNLDMGLLSHYLGNFECSNKELSSAEKLFEKNYTKSISQSAASYLVNDTVIDYVADPYEDIYTNIFMALNYLELAKTDDAFVEIRRFNNKLKTISQKYQVEIEKQRKNLKKNAVSVSANDFKFHNSALARYLSLIMYRADGNMEEAFIDMKLLKEAFTFQKDLYNFSIPKSLDEELSVPPDMVRVNFLSFAGSAPIKREENIPLFAVDGYYKIAMPVMYLRKSDVHSIECILENTDTKKMYSSKAEKLESIENIALDTYSQKYALITAKTIGRMIVKLSASTAFDVVANESDNGIVGSIFTVLGLVSRVSTFASERADVRISRFFPAAAYVSGISVPEGIYNVRVLFRGKGGKVILYKDLQNFKVSKKNVNLVEAFCLQ